MAAAAGVPNKPVLAGWAGAPNKLGATAAVAGAPNGARKLNIQFYKLTRIEFQDIEDKVEN